MNTATANPTDDTDRDARHARLKAAGWSVGDAADLLSLTPEESALIDMRVNLVVALRKFRKSARLTQTQLADKIGSAQAVIARMENGDNKATIDLFIRAILAAGATAQDVAAIFADAAQHAGAPESPK